MGEGKEPVEVGPSLAWPSVTVWWVLATSPVWPSVSSSCKMRKLDQVLSSHFNANSVTKSQ